MKTSENGRKLIEAWEGLILGAYDDANDHIVKPGQHVRGTLTIGYGHTTAAGLPRVYVGQTITKDEADAILASDLAAVEADIEHHVKVPLTQDQFDALVSFDFNTGALDRSNVLAHLNRSDYTAAAQAFLVWDHAGGRVNTGLLHRRLDEKRLWETGHWHGP